MSSLLVEAIVKMLADAAPMPPSAGGPPFALKPDHIRVGQIYDLLPPVGRGQPEQQIPMPLITVDRQGGGAWGIVAGMEDPLILVQVWSRLRKSAATALYDWVSAKIHTRARDITTAMQFFDVAAGRPAGSKCGRIYRVFQSWLYDSDLRAWYVTARYAAKIIDNSDLNAEFGATGAPNPI